MSPALTSSRAAGVGALLVLGSGILFGLTVVFAKAAYSGGASVTGLLMARFAIAAVAFWLIVAVRRPARLAPGTLLGCLGLGALGYAAQSGLYFGAVSQMDAGLAVLLLFSYPALVTLVGVLLRREPPTARRLAALACSAVGLVLVLGLGGLDTASPAGVALALGAAVTYAAYTLTAATLPRSADVFLVMAVITTSAFASLAAFTTLTGVPHGLGRPAATLGWAAAFALVGTVLALTLHQCGLQRVGPSAAAILSCVEPVVAVASVALVYGERLTPGQLAGGLAVLAGVVVLQVRAPRRSTARLSTGRLSLASAALRRSAPR